MALIKVSCEARRQTWRPANTFPIRTYKLLIQNQTNFHASHNGTEGSDPTLLGRPEQVASWFNRRLLAELLLPLAF